MKKRKKDTRIEKGVQIPDNILSDFELYKKVVWRFTNTNSSQVPNIDSRSINFHLDHKYSMKQGFIDNVPTHIIGGLNNLEIISAAANCSKQSDCSISLDDLY